MQNKTLCLVLLGFILSVRAARYDPILVPWNLNQAQDANDPMDYKGEWQNHTYHPSPDNWRFPFYTVMLDKWVNGDPTNDNSNGTVFEHDLFETQLRHGGDIRGLMDSLDYLQGMGIKVYTFHVLMLGNLLFWDHLHQCAMGVGRIFGTHPEKPN
jgi:alpha-1,3-glucan synthase